MNAICYDLPVLQQWLVTYHAIYADKDRLIEINIIIGCEKHLSKNW